MFPSLIFIFRNQEFVLRYLRYFDHLLYQSDKGNRYFREIRFYHGNHIEPPPLLRKEEGNISKVDYPIYLYRYCIEHSHD